MRKNLRKLLNKPEYFFRPSQIVRRVLLANKRTEDTFAEAILPWNLTLRFRPGEIIGASILRTGLYDLSVSEALWRLLDPGDYAIDVGANIGHMTSLMAARVGVAGTVLCFEPHPEIFEELMINIRSWQNHSCVGDIRAIRAALSDRSGKACLSTPQDFERNRGTASVIPDDTGDAARTIIHDVETRRLDEMIDACTPIGLIKIDVEGHELKVLQGGRQAFERHQIRDVVFEEHGAYPTPVTDFLENQGYALFCIAKGFVGPDVCPIGGKPFGNSYNPPNYLATTEPARALKRLQKKGWTVLSLGR